MQLSLPLPAGRAALAGVIGFFRVVFMSKQLKILVLTLSVAIVVFTIVGGLHVKAATNDGAYRQLGVFSEVLSRIRTEYVEEPNIPQVTDGALHGLLESLDANSSYLTPTEYKDYKAHKSDGKGTIGASVSKRFGYAAVISVIPGGPADKAGIDSGDIVEAIESKSTREMSLAEIESALSGQVGSNVNLSVVRARRVEPLKLTITRDNVKMPPITDKMVENGIGYIKVDTFGKGNGKESHIHSRCGSLVGQNAPELILYSLSRAVELSEVSRTVSN